MIRSITIQRLAFVLTLLILLAPLACAQNTAAKPAVDVEKPSIAELFVENLKLGPCKNGERLEAVKKLFIKMGASESDITLPKTKDLQNVVLTKKGKTDETVIIGAHYDKTRNGCGIIDNWSGVVILAHLYQTIKDVETQKTYIFAAFDKEEVGLKGSDAMAKSIPKENRPKYCSMVNLDSFGMGYPVVIAGLSSSKMNKSAVDLGKDLKIDVTSVSIAGADSDSSSFISRGIPAITLSGLSRSWSDYIHTSKDSFQNTVPGSVHVGYLFTLQYLNKIDAGTCDLFR